MDRGLASKPGGSPAGAAPHAAPEEDPARRALTIIEKCLHRATEEKRLLDLVAIDLRAVATLKEKLTRNARDPDALKWLQQLAIVWSTRLSGLEILTFREVYRLLEKCAVPRR